MCLGKTGLKVGLGEVDEEELQLGTDDGEECCSVKLMGRCRGGDDGEERRMCG